MHSSPFLSSAYARMLWPTLWDWFFLPCNRKGQWKEDSRGGHCDRNTTAVVTTPELNQQRGNKTWEMREEAWGHVWEESFNGWAWMDFHEVLQLHPAWISKGPYIAAKPKLNIFICLAYPSLSDFVLIALERPLHFWNPSRTGAIPETIKYVPIFFFPWQDFGWSK